MSPYKALRLDGFNAIFYKQSWSIMVPAVINLAYQILKGMSLPEGLEDALLVIIPKTETPCKIEQFRPISLCNVAYKIISKVF